VTQNLDMKIFVNNIFNKLYYTGSIRGATPFVFVAAGPRRRAGDEREVLTLVRRRRRATDAQPTEKQTRFRLAGAGLMHEMTMLICVPDVLSKADVATFAASWMRRIGNTAAPRGAQSALVKNTSSCRRTAGRAQLGQRAECADANPLFISRRSRLHIFPPLFNRYAAADRHHFGIHVDNAVARRPPHRPAHPHGFVVTCFLSEPEDYDGGNSIIEDLYGSHENQASGGTSGTLSGSSLHMVTP